MMQCQLCGDLNGPWEYADVYDDGKAKVMLICEDCANIIRRNKKMVKCMNCGNTRAAWTEIDETGTKYILCKDCAKIIRKEMKNNEATNLRNKRYVSGVSRTHSRCE